MNADICLVCGTRDDLSDEIYGNGDMLFRLCRSHSVRLALVDDPVSITMLGASWQSSSLRAGYKIFKNASNQYVVVWRDTQTEPPGEWQTGNPIYVGSSFRSALAAMHNYGASRPEISREVLICGGEYVIPSPDGNGIGVVFADGWRYSGEGWKTILTVSGGNYLAAIYLFPNKDTQLGTTIENLAFDGEQMLSGDAIYLRACGGARINRLYIRNVNNIGIRFYLNSNNSWERFEPEGVVISGCLFENIGHDAVLVVAAPQYKMRNPVVRDSGFVDVGQRNSEGTQPSLYANGGVRLYYCNGGLVRNLRGYRIGKWGYNPTGWPAETYNMAFVHIRHSNDIVIQDCVVESSWGQSFLYFSSPRCETINVRGKRYRYHGVYLEDSPYNVVRNSQFEEGSGGVIIGTERSYNTDYYTYMMSSGSLIEGVSVRNMQYSGIYGHSSYCRLVDVDVSECCLNDGAAWRAGERAGILLHAAADLRDSSIPYPTQPHGQYVPTGGQGIVLKNVRSRGSKQDYGLSTWFNINWLHGEPCGWLIEDCDFQGNNVAGMNLTGVEHTVRRVLV